MTYFDVKLQVLIHGINIIKDVSHDPGNDSHHVTIVEIALWQKDWKKERKKDRRHNRQYSLHAML